MLHRSSNSNPKHEQSLVAVATGARLCRDRSPSSLISIFKTGVKLSIRTGIQDIILSYDPRWPKVLSRVEKRANTHGMLQDGRNGGW